VFSKKRLLLLPSYDGISQVNPRDEGREGMRMLLLTHIDDFHNLFYRSFTSEVFLRRKVIKLQVGSIPD